MNPENESKIDKSKPQITKADFENLRSNFILKKIFFIISRYKFLEIIKYNKKLQKRVGLNINNYEEFSKLYSSIEIELKIGFEKYDKYNKFINISDKEKNLSYLF